MDPYKEIERDYIDKEELKSDELDLDELSTQTKNLIEVFFMNQNNLLNINIFKIICKLVKYLFSNNWFNATVNMSQIFFNYDIFKNGPVFKDFFKLLNLLMDIDSNQEQISMCMTDQVFYQDLIEKKMWLYMTPSNKCQYYTLIHFEIISYMNNFNNSTSNYKLYRELLFFSNSFIRYYSEVNSYLQMEYFKSIQQFLIFCINNQNEISSMYISICLDGISSYINNKEISKIHEIWQSIAEIFNHLFCDVSLENILSMNQLISVLQCFNSLKFEKGDVDIFFQNAHLDIQQFLENLFSLIGTFLSKKSVITNKSMRLIYEGMNVLKGLQCWMLPDVITNYLLMTFIIGKNPSSYNDFDNIFKNCDVEEINEEELIIQEINEEELTTQEIKEEELTIQEIKEEELTIQENKEEELTTQEIKEEELTTQEIKEEEKKEDEKKNDNDEEDEEKEDDDEEVDEVDEETDTDPFDLLHYSFLRFFAEILPDPIDFDHNTMCKILLIVLQNDSWNIEKAIMKFLAKIISKKEEYFSHLFQEIIQKDLLTYKNILKLIKKCHENNYQRGFTSNIIETVDNEIQKLKI